MSAMVEGVSSAVGGVVDAVGDAVEWVGDTAGNVVQHAMDNPVETALMIGIAAATGGAGAAALGLEAPLTAMQASSAMAGVSGASTLAGGGDIEDAFKSAATTFAVAQGVSFGMDAIGAANVPETVGGTTQFFDDGTSIQSFDDGSHIFTDTAGKVDAIPAPEPSAVAEVPPQGTPSPVEMQRDIVTEVPPELVPGPSLAELNLAAQQAGSEFAQIPDAELTTETANVPQGERYPPLEPMLERLQGAEQGAPIVERSTFTDRVDMTPTSQAFKDLGMAGIEYAKANPLEAAGMAAAGYGLSSLGGSQQEAPGTVPTKKTYSYGPAAPVRQTGLPELYSAAAQMRGRSPLFAPPNMMQAPPPQIAQPAMPMGAAPLGLRTLVMPPSVADGHPLDVRQMTPEQIIRMQDAAARQQAAQGM